MDAILTGFNALTCVTMLAGETEYHALRPDVWKQAHPEAIRIYRAEERLSRADAKAQKRARRRATKCR